MYYSRFRIHTASFTALHSPTYSASVVKVDTDYCFRDAQVTAAPPSKKTYPIVDRRSVVLEAKSKSEYP
jgi:hypothetical protein